MSTLIPPSKPVAALPLPSVAQRGSGVFARLRFVWPMLALTSSRGVGAAASLLTSLVVCRWVSPVDMGEWNRVGLLLTYLPFLRVGVTHGLARELSFAAGRQDAARQRACAGASLGLVLLLAGSCAGIGVLEWLCSLFAGVGAFSPAVRIALVLAAAQLLASHFSATYRQSKSFVRLSQAELIVVGAGAVLLVLVMTFGYRGFLGRLLVLEVLTLGLFMRWSPFMVAPSWRPALQMDLIRVGFPIMAITQTELWLGTLDRIVLIHDKEALGYLTLALLVRRSFEALAGAISIVDFAQLAELHGAEAEMAVMRRRSNTNILAMIGGGILVGGLAWAALPFMVHAFMPKYLPGVEAARWACLYGAAWAPAFSGNILKVIRRQNRLYASCLVHIVCFFGSWGLLSGCETPLVAAVKALLVARCGASLFTFITTRAAGR